MNHLSEAFPSARPASSTFYNKLYSLFGLAILGTGLGVLIGFHYALPIFAAMPALVFALWIFELGLILTQRLWATNKPLNYVLFTLFTFSSGMSIVPLLAQYALEFQSFDIIYRALFSTTALFLSMALIGSRIQKPITGVYGFLFAGLITMIIVGVLGVFIPWGNTGEMIYSGVGMMLFSLFAIVDVNRLRYYPEDQYIQAGIQLYLDIFNMFLFVLRLTGAFGRD